MIRHLYLSKSLLAIAFFALISSYCEKDSTEITPSNEDIPSIYSKVYGVKSISIDGDYIIIKTEGTPDHKSVYYETNHELYESFSGNTFEGNPFRKNPNTIVTQNLTFKIPLNPEKATNNRATSLGPIGVALNGVALYNQYAGPNNLELTHEINSFDQYYGHPQGVGQYHYHVEPLYLTTVKSTRSGLIGFLLDGFPVYGPEEDGKILNSDDLDNFHGHFHPTEDYPDGIYHYHFTADPPYLNGSGYYGTPGTISQ